MVQPRPNSFGPISTILNVRRYKGNRIFDPKKGQIELSVELGSLYLYFQP